MYSNLKKYLQEAQNQRFRMIATDGVFSMDGNVAPLDKAIAAFIKVGKELNVI